MEENTVISTLFKHSPVGAEEVCQSLLDCVTQTLDKGFRLEDISSYRHNLTVLKDLLCSYSDEAIDGNSSTKDVKQDQDHNNLANIKSQIVKNVCLPLLKHLFPSADSKSEVHVLLGIVGKLLAVCTESDDETLHNVLENLISNFEKFNEAKPANFDLQHDKSVIDIYTLLEVARYLITSITSSKIADEKLSAKLMAIFEILVEALEHISVEITGALCIPVLLRIMKVDRSNASHYVARIWKYIQNFSHLNDRRKQYMLLCGFANYFFPLTEEIKGVDVKGEREFWEILQYGLTDKDSVNRKRALYLLKRIVDISESTLAEVNTGVEEPVFWWSKNCSSELSKTWQDFMLLAEVLEEKQVHVIKPLLPRMKSLIKASEIAQVKGKPLLHTSWLKTILLRSSHHESLKIIRWAAETVLSLDLSRCPMIEQGLDQYLTGPMLSSLQESKLYSRDQGAPVGTMPVIAEKLAHYFTTCWNVMSPESRASFFCQTVQNMSSWDWGPIPLLFICRGLSQIPPSTPCLDRDTVLGLRKLLTGFLASVDTYFRGAIQGYIVQILIKLTDKSKVPLEDFMQIVCQVRREESLQRGTTLWTKCVTWFGEGETEKSDWDKEGMRQFIENSVTKFLQTSVDSKYSTADSATAVMVARLLLLASDASIATKMDANNSNTLMRVTQTLASVLNSINTHAYMSTHKADKSLLLLLLLMKESRPCDGKQNDEVSKTIQSAVESCQSEVLLYIGGQISESMVLLSDLSKLDLYTDCVAVLAGSALTVSNVQFGRLVDTCTSIINRSSQMTDLKSKLQFLSAVSILGTLSKFLSHDQLRSHDQDSRRHVELRTRICSVLKTLKVSSNFTKPSGDQSLSQQEWGRITSVFLEHEWHIVKLALEHSPAPWCDMLELLTVAEDTLSVGVEETSVIVLKCLSIIISKVIDAVSEERLMSILDTCWASFQESRRIVAFWDVLEAFVKTVFHPCLLQKQEGSPVIASLIEYAEQLIEIGTDKNGIVNALASQLCTALSEPGMMLHTDKFISILVNLCMFGGLVRRGIRQVYDICATLEAEGDACPAHGLIKGICNEDIQMRVKVINLLCHLKPDDQSHCILATRIIKKCVQVYDDVANGSANRFANSLVHRQRHRLIQTVLLLQAFVTEDYVSDLWKIVWLSLETETQPSVRHMLEWVVMWLMKRQRNLRQQLWLLFEKYRDTKNLTLCSLLSIVIHMGPHLPPDEQASYFGEAIPNILPWCMAHHFHTRIYSQAVLSKLWEQCQQLGLHDILKENAILNCIVDFSQQNRNSTRNVKKLLDSFFFKFLDFERDFTLETLYKVMPKMTALTEEDWIQPDLFAVDSQIWTDGNCSSFIQLCNVSRDFENCDPGLWKYISLKGPSDEEAADNTAADDTESDVQKKIMPWRQMMLDEETMSEVDHGVKRRIEGGLVVVTSLINKIPNLGGLCRTSEIFGVSEYVMGKLGHVHDKAFQGLSVTAHKWIPITEVYETKLADYLQQKRQEGYTLVGVEQTANSVCLTEYTFPEKTLLLLGNEKEGIPVELISLLDVCVEIPQQGVIRSLNVHVSGAILIWEYRRQQLMKTCSS